MDSLATELKKAREQKRLTLTDIADTTLINVRFLEELERGNFTFLPRTYVRAFLREYALTVGLTPEAVLRSFDAEGPAPEPSAPVTPAASPELPATPPPPPAERKINPSLALGALITIGVLAVVVAVWNILDTDTPAAVREIPFERIQAEHERKAAADTATIAIVPPAAAVRDSLVLTAATSDSVWVQLGIDNATVRNLHLKPGHRYLWKAANRFLLTVGNAGAVEFTLNKKALGKLGKPGAIVKNLELNHATLAGK